jgi:hypothetical protein
MIYQRGEITYLNSQFNANLSSIFGVTDFENYKISKKNAYTDKSFDKLLEKPIL